MSKKRFLDNGIAKAPHSQHVHGVDKTDPEKVTVIQDYFIEHPMNSLLQASIDLKIPKSTISRILRTKIKMKPYKLSLCQMLNEAQKAARLEFCDWLLQQPDEFIFDVIWDDEKWFQLNQHPNRQNTRYWGLTPPNLVLNLKNQNVKKIMAFVTIVQGKAYLFWHTDEDGKSVSVNTDQYIKSVEDVLKDISTEQLNVYWWQQDGATCHTSKKSMAYLRGIFGDRLISKQLKDFKIFGVPEWPAHSPDLNPLDFTFWGQAMKKVWDEKPSNLDELKATVQRFFDSLSPDFVKKCVANIRKRATFCVQENGGHFEHLL